jgi:hypothetical protein
MKLRRTNMGHRSLKLRRDLVDFSKRLFCQIRVSSVFENGMKGDFKNRPFSL